MKNREILRRTGFTLSALTLLGLAAACGDGARNSRASSVEPTSASADDSAVGGLRARLQGYSISEDVQAQLIDKFLAGEALDADTGAKPLSTETVTSDGLEKTRYVYADGSVAISTIEQPDVSLRSITGCTSRVDSHGTHIYSNCKIAWDAATWSVSWTADFDYNGNGSAITSAKSLHFGGIGDFSGAGTEIVTMRVDNKGTAIADGYVNQKVTVAGVGSTRRVGVRLQVATRWTDRKAKESPFST